jgi:hypothetical protein
MANTKKLLAERNPPAVGYKEKQYPKRADYKPLSRAGKARTLDATGRYVGEVALVKGAKRLTKALGGLWREAGAARCPACGRPGMVITQDSSGIVNVVCPEKCAPADIHEALLERGIGVADMWVS